MVNRDGILRKLICLLFCFIDLVALEVQPWFGDVYEFHLLSGYSFSWYNHVDGAVKPLSDTSNDHLLFGNLEFAFSPLLSVDVDAEVAKTPRQDFGMRSLAMQLRHLYFDDVIGDAVSMAMGASCRYVFPDAVRDISCPYGSNINIEGNISLGKEFDCYGQWRYRFWTFGAIGFANEGSPWLRGIVAFEGNSCDRHKWALLVHGYKGYGSKKKVDIDSFHGYASVRTRSIDLALRYGYRLDPWGTFRVEYRRRVFAKLCPERVDTIILSFLFPFSL